MNRGQKRSEWRAAFRNQRRASGETVAQNPSLDTAAPVATHRDHPPAGSTLHLRIDKLVLRGFERRDGRKIAAATEAHLQELIEVRGVPSQWQQGKSAGEISAEPARLQSRTNPLWIGEKIANAIYGGLRKERR
jgi:hypothetical protein